MDFAFGNTLSILIPMLVQNRNMLYFDLTENTEEYLTDESTSTCISYFCINGKKLYAQLQAEGDRQVKKVNYLSFFYYYACFKCSSLSVPEGGQLILHTFVSTKRTVVMSYHYL